MVFRRLLGGRPDVVAGEIDVLPAERGQVDEEVVGNVFDLAKGSDRAVQIARVPEGMAETRRLRPKARCCWFS